VIAILAVLLADMHQSTSTALAVAANQRDRLQAEYAARSGMNLTRLLVANEPAIRQIVTPIYQMLLGRPPPQLPIWAMANDVLAPICRFEETQETAAAAGVDITGIRGLGDDPGTCEILALAENSKINVSDPLLRDGDEARRSISMQLFAMVGGYQSPSPFDPLFERPDADGNTTTRLDVVSALIDWWDRDTERTTFDPGAGTVSSAGPEDDVYSRYDDPYRVKNAPFDSMEELRLVRGIGDDFWATFVEPDPDDPSTRTITIYGSGSVNPNEAPPEVLLARLCSFLEGQALCTDATQAAKFIQLVRTVRAMFPVPFFTRSADFLNFVEGRGGERDLYPMLRLLLGPDNPLLFTPVTIPNELRTEVDRSFVTAARILTIQSTGFAGRSHVRIRAVLNTHDRWAPPPPNAGSMPSLGVFHHYRID
jgi:general secretion pathway protein K